ncbi:hypothetical protein OC188_00595 [Anaplasma capra]|nr:hypothetical protein [Anaplasma capra]MCU7612288.1 hypothetical protein [Anaplasma capra]
MQFLQHYHTMLTAFIIFVICFASARSVRGTNLGHKSPVDAKSAYNPGVLALTPVRRHNSTQATPLHDGIGAPLQPMPGHRPEHADRPTENTTATPLQISQSELDRGSTDLAQKSAVVAPTPSPGHACAAARIIVDPAFSTHNPLPLLEVAPDNQESAERGVVAAGEIYPEAPAIEEYTPDPAQSLDPTQVGHERVEEQEPLLEVELEQPASTMTCCTAAAFMPLQHLVARTL